MNIALIMAAGSGTRMQNANEPKQFIRVNEKPLLVYSLETFNKVVDAIVLVTSLEYVEKAHELCKKYRINKLKAIAIGGATRQESVINGLSAIKDNFKDDSVVLIHDAARPLVSEKIIKDNIDAVNEFGAALTVIPATDTLHLSNDGEFVSSSLKRNEIYQAQTPQSFIVKDIFEAHLLAKQENFIATDDASLFNRYNKKPLHMVMGDKRNFKVTTEEDLLILKNYLNN